MNYCSWEALDVVQHLNSDADSFFYRDFDEVGNVVLVYSAKSNQLISALY